MTEETASRGTVEGMGGRAARGAAVTSGAQAVKFVVQFASVVVMSRLLAPEDFGIFGMVMPIVAFIMMVQDVGLSEAIVASPGVTERQLSGMFWINFLISAVLGASLWACAPLVASFYGEPRVEHLVTIMALSVVIAGLVTTHFAILTRRLRFGLLAVIDIATTLAGFAAAVTVASLSPGPEALAISLIASMGMSLMRVWAGLRWFPAGPSTVRDGASLLRFGAGVAGFNLFAFAARNADQVMIGRSWGAAELGHYDRAYKLLVFPMVQINGPASRVAVPMLSRIVSEPDRYRHAFRRVLQQILLLVVPGVLILIFTAHDFIPLLLGDAWLPAVPIFMWLGISGINQPMSSALTWLFVTQQRTGELMNWGAFSAIVAVAAFAAGLPWGAIGVAAAFTTADLFVRLPALWWYVGRKGPVRTRDILNAVKPFALPAIGSVAALAAVSTAGFSPVTAILTSSVAAGTAMILFLYAQRDGRAVLVETAGFARAILGGRP